MMPGPDQDVNDPRLEYTLLISHSGHLVTVTDDDDLIL